MTEENKNITESEQEGISKYRKAWNFTREILETVIVVLVLVILIRNFLGEPRWIPTASMKPTLIEGDRLIIEKVSTRFSKPQRGDIIVFYPPFEKLDQSPWSKFTRLVGYFNSDTAYIKRIIGVPGDMINIKDGEGVYINGKPLNESYKREFSRIGCSPGMYCESVKVPKGNYFMMGDNRSNSQDSRFWGFLPEDRIIGKAYFRFWPINRVGLIEHPKYNQ
ncbi:MAG: signal peptidase I [Candidatus Melainabacteria bacterium RIFOXYA12_FULL_32_12]|nr:MAG: signal peptidase I [Candidatus Melainabacteria bacterium RIFOXYA2_FULL_32_9]OGI28809.1 MAG: signal peptidase I [Candidatus Melainabacteria bacterium RIFOXYA12_FULL_32_12]